MQNDIVEHVRIVKLVEILTHKFQPRCIRFDLVEVGAELDKQVLTTLPAPTALGHAVSCPYS